MHKEPICVFIQAFKAGAKNFKLNETASLCDVMVVTINDVFIPNTDECKNSNGRAVFVLKVRFTLTNLRIYKN